MDQSSNQQASCRASPSLSFPVLWDFKPCELEMLLQRQKDRPKNHSYSAGNIASSINNSLKRSPALFHIALRLQNSSISLTLLN